MRRLAEYALLIVFLCAVSCVSSHDNICTPNQPLPVAQTNKPEILVIGDSISIGYTPYVQQLMPSYELIHNPCNAMSSEWTRSQLKYWVKGRHFRAIVWNNGLWDIASWQAVYPFRYEQNLKHIARVLKNHADVVVFPLSTHVPVGAEGRDNADVIVRNQIAISVMLTENVPVVDLYSISVLLPHPSPTDPHFTSAGYQALGMAVSNELHTLGL